MSLIIFGWEVDIECIHEKCQFYNKCNCYHGDVFAMEKKECPLSVKRHLDIKKIFKNQN